MSDQQSILLQSVFHEANEFDLSFLKSCTLVETLDLSGPRLIMKINDRFSILRNRFRVKPGDLLKVTLNTEGYWYNDAAQEFINFRVWSMPVDNHDIVTFNCMQEDVANLKEPVAASRLYPAQSPEIILKDLFPVAAGFDIDEFPTGNPYQILAGERPSLMLRQMARELGAAIWFQRGVVCCKDLLQLADPVRQSNFIFVYNNVENLDIDTEILAYEVPNIGGIAESLLKRNYCGWSMTEGFIKSAKNIGAPTEFTSHDSQITLDNLSKILVPSVSFTAAGNTAIMAGLMLRVIWNLDETEAPLDESLPEDVLVGTVAHHYEAQKYFIRVKGVDLLPPYGPLSFGDQ